MTVLSRFSPTLRAGLAFALLSSWLVLFFSGFAAGGSVHLLLALAAVLFPWSAPRGDSPRSDSPRSDSLGPAPVALPTDEEDEAFEGPDGDESQGTDGEGRVEGGAPGVAPELVDNEAGDPGRDQGEEELDDTEEASGGHG